MRIDPNMCVAYASCMDVRDRIARIEPILRASRVSVSRVCHAADLHPTTWMRWKNGTAEANQASWSRIEVALERVAPDAWAAISAESRDAA